MALNIKPERTTISISPDLYLKFREKMTERRIFAYARAVREAFSDWINKDSVGTEASGAGESPIAPPINPPHNRNDASALLEAAIHGKHGEVVMPILKVLSDGAEGIKVAEGSPTAADPRDFAKAVAEIHKAKPDDREPAAPLHGIPGRSRGRNKKRYID